MSRWQVSWREFGGRIYRVYAPIIALCFRVCMLMGMMCWFFSANTGQALASQRRAVGEYNSTPVSSMQVGPYKVEVQFSSNPPHVEEPLVVTIHVLAQGRFSGRISGLPGLGTDAVPVHANLATGQGDGSVLTGALRLSVRGSWHLVIELEGARGSGTATMDVTVSAPDAIPTWLGWLIGLSPLLGCAWLVYQQARYRKKLLGGVTTGVGDEPAGGEHQQSQRVRVHRGREGE